MLSRLPWHRVVFGVWLIGVRLIDVCGRKEPHLYMGTWRDMSWNNETGACHLLIGLLRVTVQTAWKYWERTAREACTQKEVRKDEKDCAS
jgi:hypothetical protein